MFAPPWHQLCLVSNKERVSCAINAACELQNWRYYTCQAPVTLFLWARSHAVQVAGPRRRCRRHKRPANQPRIARPPRPIIAPQQPQLVRSKTQQALLRGNDRMWSRPPLQQLATLLLLLLLGGQLLHGASALEYLPGQCRCEPQSAMHTPLQHALLCKRLPRHNPHAASIPCYPSFLLCDCMAHAAGSRTST